MMMMMNEEKKSGKLFHPLKKMKKEDNSNYITFVHWLKSARL